MAKDRTRLWGLLFIGAGVLFALLPCLAGLVMGLSTTGGSAGYRIVAGPDVDSGFVGSFWVFLLLGVPALVSMGFGIRVLSDRSFSFSKEGVSGANTMSVIWTILVTGVIAFWTSSAFEPMTAGPRLMLIAVAAPSTFILVWPVAYASNS